MKTEAIKVLGLSKKFGNKLVVNSVDLSIARGEVFGFLGPNGSGKTTTIRMLCGLYTPSSGTGFCLGYDLYSQREQIKKKCAYMPQKFSLYADLTVAENLRFMSRIFGISAKTIVPLTMQKFQLQKYEHYLAGQLSGGWKQRLALACCFLHQPELVFLDEPTAGIDPKARREFWDIIHEFASQGVTFLVATHYMDEAERCHRLAYIFDGKILASGNETEILRRFDLASFKVSGPNVSELIPVFKSLAEVSEIILFGNELHLHGKNNQQLAAVIKANISQQYRVTPARLTLEDAFILLQQQG